ncbi:hypothetical protein [Saccharibacillus sp. JS10]|uniref:hypothetical protein n=1 Tax=Saccharibacillus sp. JS10 TaxID=2950552 RepID=UPI002108C7D5|nr:hypothetical protein [Saccharibacillus sp. JS10]MCQ4088070.1 hypothetical protein [Saccharibacillus sp. JS10]
MATVPNHLPTFAMDSTFTSNSPFFLPPDNRRNRHSRSRSNSERNALWRGVAANAVYLTGSLLFLAGNMEWGSILFLSVYAVTLLRMFSGCTRSFRIGMLHELLPLMLYSAGSCFFYARDIDPGTLLFIAGSVHTLIVRVIPAIRSRDGVALGMLVPLVISFVGCFFFLTDHIRIVGTLLFIVSNAMMLHRSLFLVFQQAPIVQPTQEVASPAMLTTIEKS